MSAQVLIQQLLSQRDSWCTLREAQDGQAALRVLLRRPAEGELHRFGASNPEPHADRMRAAVVDYAQAWEGFTEAELLGAAVGASDPLPFDRDLWAVVVLDRADWIGLCSAHLMDAIAAHMAQRQATAKN